MKRTLFKTLTLVGCFSTGIIYGCIGVIAILSFLRLKDGGADESSFFVLLNGFLLGRLLNWIIILGAVCFIIWRFYEAFADPHKTGNNGKGILVRTGAAFSAGADALIALGALQALFSEHKVPVDGLPVQQRTLVAEILVKDLGPAVLITIASVILLTSLVLLFYGLSRRFTEAIKEEEFSKGWAVLVHVIAYYGYLARGVILGLIGFFLFKAVLANDSSYVINTDKAFDFIGDNIGGVAFIATAMGTISYGIYMFVLGLHYEIDVA